MKFIYIVLGFLSLALGIMATFRPILPPTPIGCRPFLFLAQGTKRLEQWFLGTSIYQKHLKSFNENRTLKKNTKICILSFATTMLLIGFYFTPSVMGRSVIAALICIKFWFFLFWVKTENE